MAPSVLRRTALSPCSSSRESLVPNQGIDQRARHGLSHVLLSIARTENTQHDTESASHERIGTFSPALNKTLASKVLALLADSSISRTFS